MEHYKDVSCNAQREVFLLGMANSGASKIAERYVARSPGTSGLLLPGYSSRYFALTVSICSAMTLLCVPFTM